MRRAFIMLAITHTTPGCTVGPHPVKQAVKRADVVFGDSIKQIGEAEGVLGVDRRSPGILLATASRGDPSFLPRS